MAAARGLCATSPQFDSTRIVKFSAPHFAAARVLDGVAQFAPRTSPTQSREWGLWAAAAFAQTGNFPSSTVVARRTFVRLRGQDAETAALLCAVAPSLASSLWADTPVAKPLSDYLKTGNPKEAAATRRAWTKIQAQATDKYPSELWDLAKRGLEAALDLATAKVLLSAQAAFPTDFISHLTNRVPVLLPPQVEAVQEGFLDGNGNALAALAPGSGKTLLGELFLASALGDGDEPRWAVFVVPYVALGRSVVAAVKAHSPSQVRLHQWLGQGREDDLDISGGAHLVVATPEKLDAFLRRHPESWQSLRAAVFDEAHLVGEGARGVRLEGLLTRLKRSTALASQRILLLSAALGDYEQLTRWIDAKHIIASPWTPTARRLAFWRPNGRIEWHADLSGRGLEPLGQSYFEPPHPHLRPTGKWPRMREAEPMVRENVAHLAYHLFEERGGPILCLCSTRRATRELGAALGQKWPDHAEVTGHRAAAIEAIETRHRTLLPLAELLKKGVAWHNSSLPPEVRAAIEAGIAEGEIAVVAATSTLAEGVDLPFRFTLVADWLKWEDGGQKPLSPALFRNIAGRCGRAGAFTEGDTIVFDNPLGAEEFTASGVREALQKKLYLGHDLDRPRSTLEHIPDGLKGRTDVDATFETQLLAALGESSVGFPDTFLNATFLAQRAPESLEAWREQAEISLHNWESEGLVKREDTDLALTTRGAAWRASDLSPATCRRLLGALETLPHGNYQGVSGLSRLNAYLWRALGAAPEAGGEIERFFAPRSRLVATPPDLEALSANWLRGTSPEAIFAALPRVERAAFPGMQEWVQGVADDAQVCADEWNPAYERWLDFVRAGLETWSPWLWRACGVLAPLAGGAAAKVDWRNGASLWEMGVDTLWASRALAVRAPGTRAVIAAVGRVWPFEIRDVTLDPLALSLLKEEKGLKMAEDALALALKEVGGRYCVAGRNMLELRDWIWGKAGLSK